MNPVAFVCYQLELTHEVLGLRNRLHLFKQKTLVFLLCVRSLALEFAYGKKVSRNFVLDDINRL